MKKTLLLITVLLLTFFAFGEEVAIEQAKQVAQSYLTNNVSSLLKGTTNFELTDAGEIFNRECFVGSALKSDSKKNRDIYVFNIGENNGFIIVSGDDAAIPILAYSNSGSITPNEMPQNVVKWLEGYKQQILYIKKNDVEQTKLIEDLWKGSNSKLKSTKSSVSPLLSTKWNQAPYVNAYCPYDYDYNELTVTGCPATAMAQIMKYWEYPAKGSGFHSYQHNKYGVVSANFGATYYDWDAMPNVVNSSNDAVATLMYHCGVAVEMNYGVEVSGSYMIKRSGYSDNQTVENALPTYFGYASTIEGLERADYTDREWKSILKEELSAGRPIQYAGYGQGGHTWVCDGYDENDYFHMNWGWGGYCDAYFLLDALSPGIGGVGSGAGNYNFGQQALIGIKPPTSQQTYELEIYEDVEISKPTIRYGEGFTITTDILNDGSNAFYGDYCAAVFNDQDVCVDIVEIKEDRNLTSGYHYTNGITFSTEGMFSLLPGDYYIRIFYRPTGGNWNIITADFWSFFTKDYVEFEVENFNIPTLYSEISVLTENVYSNNPLSVWLDVDNGNPYDDFKGSFVLALYDLEGWRVTTIEEKTNMSLPYNCHYENGLTFSTENLDVEPGTYLLALQHKRDGGNYELTGSRDSYINPIKIIVKQAPYEKDIYEDNNFTSESYNLSVNFINNSASVATTGSNIHVGNDWDFYSIDLESGYNYNIDIQLHDSYSDGNEESYSVDGLFLYSLDGENWSEAYDYLMVNSITTSGGKTLYCMVSPYFLGETGTYLLEINMSRASSQTSSAETYSLSFNLNGGEGLAEDIIVTNGEVIGTLPVVTKEGYEFLGWFIDYDKITEVTVWEYSKNKIATALWEEGKYETSIEDNTATNLSIYPNPATDLVYIEGVEATEIQIVNVFGSLVKVVSNTQEVDVSVLKPGVYFINITTTTGVLYSKKIIKK